MAKESTLKRIEFEIATGDLAKARDRLHGLIHTFPEDLSLRSRLAGVYWKLQHADMAGCYWFLEENETEETKQAVASFEESCGGDPMNMYRRIKFKGSPDSATPFARQRLEVLISLCKKRHGRYPDFRGNRTRYAETAKHKWSNRLIEVGCMSILIAIGLCAIVGPYAIGLWLT